MTEQVDTPVFSTTPPWPAFDPELIPALEAMGVMPGGSAPALSAETLPVMRSMLGETAVPGQPKPDLTVDVPPACTATIVLPDGQELTAGPGRFQYPAGVGAPAGR